MEPHSIFLIVLTKNNASDRGGERMESEILIGN